MKHRALPTPWLRPPGLWKTRKFFLFLFSGFRVLLFFSLYRIDVNFPIRSVQNVMNYSVRSACAPPAIATVDHDRGVEKERPTENVTRKVGSTSPIQVPF